MFILDKSKAKVWQLSSDAFFYLYSEEPMLDEDNMEEAEEVLASCPNGYEIQDDWAYVDDDLIAATIIPYSDNIVDYDVEFPLTKDMALWLKWKDSNTVEVWEHHFSTGEIKSYGPGIFDVKTNQFGKRYFERPSREPHTPSCIFYIDKFK